MKNRLNPAVDYLIPLGFGAMSLIIWEIAVKWRNVPEWILPGPLQIIATFLEVLPWLGKHAWSTMQECLIGFGLAILLALVIAFIMEEISLIKKMLYPLIIISQTVPIVSVAPLFIIWFGYGILPKIIVVILVCFFPIAVSLLNGLASVDKEYLELFRSMRASRLAAFRMVKLPLALPALFSGLKISAAYSVMGAVIGEWLGAKTGLGYYMTLAQHSFQVDRVFASILAITLLSIVLFGAVCLMERIVIPWNRLPQK